MGKSFKRVFALCLAAVMMIASSMAVLAAPTSPSEGGKTVEPVITKQSSTTNTSKGTVKVFYKHKNSEQFVIQYKLRKSSWSKATKKTTTNSNLLLTDLTKKGGLYEKKVADGFEVLEVAKGLWVEAIFAKTKPEAEKPKMKFSSYDSEGEEDEDADVEIEDTYNKPDEDDVEIEDPDDDDITEDNYSTMMDLGSGDPDEEAEGLADYGEE